MKWIVGTIAIVLVLALLIGALTVLGENGFLVILLLGAFILLAPAVGEVIINWYKEQRLFRKKHPLPDALSMVTDHDLEIMRNMRKHTHNE